MQYAPPLPLSIPIRGLNKRLPLSQMPPEFCTWALNWEPEAQYLRVRNGYVIQQILPATVSVSIAMAPYQDISLFVYTQNTSGSNTIYEVYGGTLAHTAADNVADEAHAVLYANRLSFVVEADVSDCARTYSSFAWGAFDFSPTAARGGTTYKGRVFLFNQNYVYFSALEAVTGALTTQDFTTLFVRNPTIRWVYPLTSSSSRADEQYLCFGSASGEILVYAGDNPDAANWEQIARFDTAKVVGYNQRCALPVKNDVFVITDEGILSVRRLFQDLEDPNDYFLTKEIAPYYRQFIKLMKNDAAYADYYSDPSMAYHASENKLYVLLNGHLNNDGTWEAVFDYSTMLVYNFLSAAWQIHKFPSAEPDAGIGGVSNIVEFKDEIFFLSNNCLMTIGDGFKDEVPDGTGGTFQAYDVELHSAYQNFLRPKKHKQVQGFDLIINTDFTGSQINMKAACDMGRKVSLGSSQLYPISGYQNPFYNVGIDGNYIQWRIEGTSDITATAGFELHSVGVSLL